MPNTAQRGQALVIILLVLAVALTVVLSVVSRSVTDIAITTKEEDASRAFSAAEAGVEEALITGADVADVSIGEAKYSVDVEDLAVGGREFPYPEKISAGDAATVWFISHAPDGSLTCPTCYTGSSMKVCWGEPGTRNGSSDTPALEAATFYKTSGGEYRVARAAFDPNATRRADNSFSTPSLANGSCSIAGQNYAFATNVSFSGFNTGLQLSHLRLLYNTDRPHSVGATVPSGQLPSQGKKIQSTGTAGEATRKVEVYELFSDLPPIFGLGVFTGSGGISK